jgi:hypothetical protein
MSQGVNIAIRLHFWRCIVGRAVSDVSNTLSAFTFKLRSLRRILFGLLYPEFFLNFLALNSKELRSFETSETAAARTRTHMTQDRTVHQAVCAHIKCPTLIPPSECHSSNNSLTVRFEYSVAFVGTKRVSARSSLATRDKQLSPMKVSSVQ